MTILVDTREQLPYHFHGATITSPKVNYCTTSIALNEGDYLVYKHIAGVKYVGPERASWDTMSVPIETVRIPPDVSPTLAAVVERKSLSDLLGTATRSRDRFERELTRISAAGYGYRALIIEECWCSILKPEVPSYRNNMTPKALLASLLAWSQRYGIHVFPCPNRMVAEVMTYRILERWFRDGLLAAPAAGQ